MSLIAGGLALAGALGGAAISASSSSNLNRKNRQFQSEMLTRQQLYNDTVLDRQIAFQREVNRQNFEWNHPAAIRKRLEDAGYNPYLADNSASGSASGTSLSSGSQSFAPNQVDNPGVYLGNALGSAVSTFQGAYNQAQALKGQDIDVSKKDYDFQKQKDNDAYSDPAGNRAYLSTGMLQIAQANKALADANIAACDSAIKEITAQWQQSAAVDENGQVITDESGRAVTNQEQNLNIEQDKAYQGVLNLIQDVQNKKVQLDNTKIDTLIKKYTYDKLLPEQVSQLKKTLAVLDSQITSNYASARASIESAVLSSENAFTIRRLRPFNVSYGSWQAQDMKHRSKSSGIDYLNKEYDWYVNDWNRSYRGSYFGKFIGGAGGIINDFLPTLGIASKFIK